MGYVLSGSAIMVAFLSFTSSEALNLRLRIQKAGSRNLSWNQKPQLWKERNVRRGGSAAHPGVRHLWRVSRSSVLKLSGSRRQAGVNKGS